MVSFLNLTGVNTPYRNNKLGTSYQLIAEGLDCNNDRNNDLTVLYTYNKGFLLNLRLFIVRLLLPDHLFIRSYKEFKEKFTEEK